MQSNTNKRPLRVVAAVIGLAAILVLIAWLSIAIVKNVPGSFASLASLAESVRSFDASQVDNNEDTTPDSLSSFIVTSNTNVVDSEGTVRLSWTDTTVAGTFVFSYECTDGISVSIMETSNGNAITCDTVYDAGTGSSLEVKIASEKDRFADIAYSIGFIPEGTDEPTAVTTGALTVINDNIADQPLVTPSPTTPSEPDEPTPETTPDTPVTTTEQFFTYTPVSDPNGRTDLAVRFIAVGELDNNSFVPGAIERGEAGAIQFEVKNLGSKTSDDWTYNVSLPSGLVRSDDQEPLKPNEAALITIGFPRTNTSSYTFSVTLTTDEDGTDINNQFSEAIIFE